MEGEPVKLSNGFAVFLIVFGGLCVVTGIIFVVVGETMGIILGLAGGGAVLMGLLTRAALRKNT